MVQQMLDSKFSEYGLCSPERILPACDKQPVVAVKKTPLRDSQNERIMAPNSSFGNSLFSNIRGPAVADRVCGSKRLAPESSLSPPQCQSPSNSSVSGHLVYVRRKFEIESGKGSSTTTTTSELAHPSLACHLEETNHQRSQMKDPKLSCYSAFSPLPVTSFQSSSLRASTFVPLPREKYTMRLLPGESPQNRVGSTANEPHYSSTTRNLHWEDRYYHLQMLLKKLDQSDQEDYVQMLRSVTSVELSRHAVELEKRSIQLSLEEAKEVQRVSILNVLGKAGKNVTTPATS